MTTPFKRELVDGVGARSAVPGLPVVSDDLVSLSELLVGQEDVPGVRHSEEMLGPTKECALVPPGLLDVYGRG